ncbi:MAG: GAF domain-containing protein, partial [Anaerolineales bacterium]|nr:GAF domain-containing protein [Anaerolineales bacterium]
ERTRNIERRALLLQAAVEVGQAAIQTRDIQSLLSRITHLISQRFGFYHVGIFLLDERGEYAVLRAANSEGGQRMLARGHKLRVGQTGIVGYVTGRGEARIALDVGADAVFFDNPDLPNTRSEMALPLMVGDTILGALDVQSTEEAAFQEEDIATLQVMANQIAIAIDNARLFAENQAALEAIRRAYGEASRKAWQEWLLEHASVGYLVSANDRLWPVSVEEEEPAFQQAMQQSQPILASDGKTLFVPILMRGQAIGGLRLVKPEKATWDDEEIEIVQAMVEQLSAALESARLFEEVAARAERERTVAEVTTAIRSVADPETMLRIAMEELKRALNADEVAIRPYNSQKT